MVDGKEGFKNTILMVNAGKNIKEKEVSKPWSKSIDEILIAKEASKYNVKAERVWKDNHISAWQGKNITV